jgi:hypothetical protein
MPFSMSPIFIVGANRSGTTLLRLILNAHPRIAIPDELGYFDFNFSRRSFRPWHSPTVPPEQYEEFVIRFLERNEAALAPLSINRLKDDILSSPRLDLRVPYTRTLQAWTSHHGKSRWGEKTPGNLFYVDLLYDMFPEARFIYLVRDPRAGVNSMNRSILFSDDTVLNALNRRKYMQEGFDLLQATVPAEQRTVLKYEDLVAAPEATVQDLCTFIGEQFAPQMLNFHQDADQYMRPRAVKAFNQAATQPILKSKIDAWCQDLSADDVAMVEWICAASMRKHDYVPTGVTPSVLARCVAFSKRLYWQYQCRSHANSPGYIQQAPVLARFRNRAKDYLNDFLVRGATDPPT